MKKSILSGLTLFSFLSLLFNTTSCSNTQESKLVYSESNTIKQNVKEKEQDITWTLELEEDRLSKTITRDSMVIGQDVFYNIELFKIDRDKQKPVYPSFTDFGSLDTSSLNPLVKNRIKTFIESFSSENHNGSDAAFSRKYVFNYVFFLNDFEAGWKKNFNEEIPDPSKLFTKWILGEPFNGADIIQIPVRFYTDYGTIDMTLFLSAYGSNEFYQITIDRWQKV